jgi:hypothetical protein
VKVRTRIFSYVLALLILAQLASSAQPQPNEVSRFFREDIGLNSEQIAQINNGQPVAETLRSRKAAEVFLFGAVYIHATPESYLNYATDFTRIRKLPNSLAFGVFSNPPTLSDLKGFSFDNDDLEALKKCEPGNCLIQMPATSIEELQQSIDWSVPNAGEKVNQLLRKTALERLLAYQREGNQALGEYNDKRDPTLVSQQFAYILSDSKVLPERLPDFYRYLLDYPSLKPENVDDRFYWTRVKFGLKPTLRVVQMLILHGNAADRLAYAIAEKQLYASHYFETALDLSFCVRGSDDVNQPGFYLIMLMGSEQAGLTGPKGSIVRKVAVGRSVSNLQAALMSIKNGLEQTQ